MGSSMAVSYELELNRSESDPTKAFETYKYSLHTFLECILVTNKLQLFVSSSTTVTYNGVVK